jgi:hypothetical protein
MLSSTRAPGEIGVPDLWGLCRASSQARLDPPLETKESVRANEENRNEHNE